MKVRYHIVPERRKQTALMIEIKDKTVKIKNVLSQPDAFKELQNKLEEWYQIKQIPVRQLASDDADTLFYGYATAPIHDHTPEEYYMDDPGEIEIPEDALDQKYWD